MATVEAIFTARQLPRKEWVQQGRILFDPTIFEDVLAIRTKHWSKFRREVLGLFRGISTRQEARHAFRLAQHNTTETYSQFMTRLKRLAHKGYRNIDSDARDVYIKDVFMDNLTDNRIKMAILASKSVDSYSVAELATKTQEIFQQINPRSQASSSLDNKPREPYKPRINFATPQIPRPSYIPRPIPQQNTVKNTTVPNSPVVQKATASTPNTKSKVTCYNCNKLGHIARECRAPKNPNGIQGNWRAPAPNQQASLYYGTRPTFSTNPYTGNYRMNGIIRKPASNRSGNRRIVFSDEVQSAVFSNEVPAVVFSNEIQPVVFS